MFDKPRPGVPGGSSALPPTKDVEDIFAKVGEMPISPAPSQSVFSQESSTPPPPTRITEMMEEPNQKKRWLRFVIFIVLFLIVLGVGYTLWRYIFAFSPSVEPIPVSLEAPQPVEPIPATPPANDIAKPKEEDPAEKDSDSDGISDQEEATLKTNPKDFDSDDDGLFDFDEVRVYETDPLASDTDTDGFKDGEEVRNGYNPKGAGKLFEIP